MKASVIMSIFNGEKYLSESITSVLNQSFSNFEFIIIDDGSIDQSVDIVKKFKDPRIHFFSNKKNYGLPYSLNRAIKQAKGQYLLRMDQDDICLSERFQTQIEYMDSHSEIDICGTAVTFLENGKKRTTKPLTNSEEMKAALLFRNVLAHPSVIMRKSKLLKYNFLYDPNVKNAEDYDLWTRSCWKLKMTNLPFPLIFYRRHEDQMIKMANLGIAVANSRRKFLTNFNEKPTHQESDIHFRITSGKTKVSWLEINAVEKWLEKLLLANRTKGLVQDQAMNKIISAQWLTICLKSSKLGKSILNKYFLSPLAPQTPDKLKYATLLAFKILRS